MLVLTQRCRESWEHLWDAEAEGRKGTVAFSKMTETANLVEKARPWSGPDGLCQSFSVSLTIFLLILHFSQWRGPFCLRNKSRVITYQNQEFPTRRTRKLKENSTHLTWFVWELRVNIYKALKTVPDTEWVLAVVINIDTVALDSVSHSNPNISWWQFGKKKFNDRDEF